MSTTNNINLLPKFDFDKKIMDESTNDLKNKYLEKNEKKDRAFIGCHKFPDRLTSKAHMAGKLKFDPNLKLGLQHIIQGKEPTDEHIKKLRQDYLDKIFERQNRDPSVCV